MMARVTLALLSAVLASGLIAAPVKAETGITDKEIVIGAFGVLTGPVYNYGKTAFDGAEMIYNETNAAGGINGRQIRFVREDDQCKPDVAVPAVRKLIYDDQVFMINGGACSNASLAAMPEIVRAEIPWVITDSTAPQLTDPPNPYIFTTFQAGWMETAAQLQHALEIGAKKIAIVRQHDAWAESRYPPLIDAMKKRGLTPVADEEVAPDVADTTAVALRVQASGADTVLLLLFPQAATVFMRDTYKIGYKPLAIGGSPLGDVEDMQKAIGIPGATAKFQGLAPTRALDDPAVQKYRPMLKKYFPNAELTPWHLVGIATAQFVVEALKKTGPELTRAKLAATMSTLSMTPDVYAGPVKCTPEDHQCYRTVAWYGMVDGKMKQVGETTLP
jgi:branched-chain amino acid transport system substrate-binding protein